MYPVTKAVADQFKTNAKQNLSLLVNPVVGESFELTSADILSAGLNINRYSATGDSVALGVCSAADLSLRVENGDGRFNDVVFEGAQIYASVGVEDGNNTQWVPLGYFTVDNAPRRLAVISITALDGMVQFDKLANRSALSLPNSVKNIVLACCNECNITINTDLDALPNSSFVAQSVGDSEDLTYRTILQWCCQVMGVNGYMDWDGHLELSWYKKDGIPETVSGSIATFESVTEVPVSQLVLNIVPKQSFNGYNHPWVGGGNGNYLPNNATDGTTTLNGITLKEANGVYSLSGTASAETTFNISLSASVDLSPSTNKICFLNSASYSAISVGFTRSGTRIHYWSISPSNRVISGWTDTGNEVIDGVRIVIANGTAISGTLTISPMLVKTTDTSPTSFTPYSNICPISGWTGMDIYVSHTTDEEDATVYEVSWQTEAGTVYGGTLDVTTGVLTVTHKMKNFDNYTGTITKSGSTTIPEGRIVWYIPAFPDSPNSGGDANPNHVTMKCSIYDIQDKSYQYNVLPATSFAMGIGRASGHAMVGVNLDSSYSTTALVRAWLQSSHVDIWYPLATPETYQLTPVQVELLKGTNNIWADDSTLSVTFPVVTEITPADRYNSDIYENAVTITGVSVKGKENQSVAGSEDYALAIDGNPLFTDDDVETIANGLSGLIGFSYHPFSASVLPMPYLYPLDMVAVQYKDEWYDCAITEINFTSTAPTQLKGTGESAQSRSYARINPLTNRERAIIENLKDEMNTTLNKAVNNIIDFNNIISNALGLYHTNVADGSGGFIRYLHDAPDLESSTYIVTETAQGFAWTTNGWNGGTPVWQYGVTSGGYALFKWLSAEGIDVTRASSDYRAEVTPEHFNIYYKSDLIITIDATDRAIQTPRMVIPYSSTSNNSLRVGQLVWLPTPNGANAVVLGS